VASSSDELFYANIAYAAPWLDGALWTEVGGSLSETHQLDAFAIDPTDGESERFYARATVPLVRSRAQSLWAAFLFDGRESNQSDSGGMLSDERTRVLRGSLSYTLVDGATRSDVTIETSHGLDAFGASLNGESQLTRPDGRPQFTKVRMDGALSHKVSDRWSASLFVAGQHADGSLVGGEEFGAGGARYGRAYDYSEIIGDDGAAAAIELRYTLTGNADWLTSLQLYAFADAAMIWNRASDPSAMSETSLSSAGLGVRLTLLPGVTATFELAQPLSRDVADNGDRSLRPLVTLQVGW
jgi:hemolysin activation/secretion protein